MSTRTVLLAAFRLMLVLAVAASGISFSAHDAEARRGFRVRSSGDHHSSSKDHGTSEHGTTAKRKADEEHHEAEGADRSGATYIPGVRVRSREATRGAETANDGEDPTSPRPLPRSRIMTVKPIEDVDVPNCPTGMICTVCLAGCDGTIGGIVDAQTKTPIPVPER